MSRNVSRAASESTRKSRRRNSILLSIAAAAVIILLLAFEQIALLYLIATLGVAALLTVVAFADLHGVRQTVAASAAPTPADDAAAIADRTAATRPTPATSFGSTAPRRPKRRQRR
jgi:hypothetical protein